MRRPARVISPEILPDNRVIFRVYSPEARTVSVNGEWQSGYGGSENLARNDTGMFTLTVGPLEPELYAYTFTVDGVRSIDANNVQVRRDGVNYQSYFIVPGPESDLYEQKENVAHGTVTKIWYMCWVSTGVCIYIHRGATREEGRNILYSTCFMVPGVMRMPGPIWDVQHRSWITW